MKIAIDSGIMSEKLGLVQGISERRATLPILSHVLITAKPGSVELRATDLETTITTSFEASVEGEGSVAIPARKAFEIVKELPPGTVELEVMNNHWVEIKSSSSTFKIAGLPGEDFPEAGEVSTEGTFTLKCAELEEMIAKTMYAATLDELRRNLSGIYFEQSGPTTLRLVATDGHRLSLADVNTGGEFEMGSSFLVPKKGVGELRKLLRLGEEVRINAGAQSFVAEVDGVVLVVKLIDAEFPNYKQVIPEKTAHSFNVGREELLGALRRVSLMSSEKTKGIKLNIGGGALVLSSVSPEVGEAREEMPADFEGTPVEVGFNSRYLMDILESSDADTFIFGLTDEMNPSVLRPLGDDGFVAVVMPMRI